MRLQDDREERADAQAIRKQLDDTLAEPDAEAVGRRFAPQFEACEELLLTSWANRPAGDLLVEKHHFVLMNIYARSTLTYRAVLKLALSGYEQQAMMLTRSLFEDVITAHWVAVPANREEALRRLAAQEDHSALIAEDFVRAHQDWVSLTPSDDPHLEARRKELTELFGPYGEKLLVGSLYSALSEIRDVWARHGDPDDLLRYYGVFQRYANERLHTTANALKENFGTRSLGRTHYFDFAANPKADESGMMTVFRCAFFCLFHLALLLLHETGRDPSPVERLRENFSIALTKMTPSALRRVGRNERCPCGSGRKFKDCHGR